MGTLKQQIDFLVGVLADAGVTTWMVSPGSRNAPIVAGMLRHGKFDLYSFPDERVAAFAALGFAQGTRHPAGVICTSGTAATNLYPAICEAFYQRVPLLAITADRPPELIDQWDGQTIHQNKLFHPHCTANTQLPTFCNDLSASQQRIIIEAIESTTQNAIASTLFPIPGPAHINIPLREPIYEGIDSIFELQKQIKPFVFAHNTPIPVSESLIMNTILSELNSNNSSKILIVVGMHHENPELTHAIQDIGQFFPVLCDVNSKQHSIGLQPWDLALITNPNIPENLIPNTLITMGMGLVSKPIKQWLKAHKPARHFHVSAIENDAIGDPFQTKPKHLFHNEVDFLFALAQCIQKKKSEHAYLENWRGFINSAKDLSISAPFRGEYLLVKSLLKQADSNMVFQIGNSMSIRYASWAGSSQAQIFANRGTSGIDGSLSTAVGYALAHPSKKIIALLGDVSAIYDAHAFWTNKLPKNLIVIVINNGGGQIFNWIQGTNQLPNLLPFIETPQQYNLQHLCDFYEIGHQIQTEIPNSWSLKEWTETGNCTMIEFKFKTHPC